MPGARKSGRAPRRGPRKTAQRKRHSVAEREKILAEASALKLTGKQVAEKFGISAVTYYVWRMQAGRGPRCAPTNKCTLATAAEAKLRAAVRAKVTGLLPRILEEEVNRLLGG